MAKIQVGILGVGVYLPTQTRLNDWWPEAVVQGWTKKKDTDIHLDSKMSSMGSGQRQAFEAICAQSSDPFRAARQRRVMSKEMTSTSMEVEASSAALKEAGVHAEQIDLILTQAITPDDMATNMACDVHRLLGVPRKCLTLSVDGACNAFALQLELAQRMIEGGAAKRALLVQSCALSRVLPYDQMYSALFGDGAAAVVVGPVSDKRGILGSAHRTDGRFLNTIITGVPGGHWYDEGRSVLYPKNMRSAYSLFLELPDGAQEVVGAAMAEAGLGKDDIDFYACHQGMSWIRPVTQAYLGLDRARSADTFAWAGSLAGANIPMVLATGQREGRLKNGDLVATFSGGTGTTWSSHVLRWGVE